MLRNRPMRHFHQEVTSRIAIHQMLTMLPEQLTKDEADIDARENLDGFSLDEEMEKAEVAVRIQARYRGRAQRLAAKRKERKEQEKAALVIQARLRGRSVRKQMKDEKEMQAKLYGRDWLIYLINLQAIIWTNQVHPIGGTYTVQVAHMETGQ